MPSPSVPNRDRPGLKQFRHEGCISHFLFDPATRELAIIDPRSDLMEDYRAAIAERRLKPVLVIDTRLHAHHLSGSHLLSAEFRVPVAMSESTSSSRVTRRLAHGESLPIGNLELRILATPGVASDAICLLESSGVLFTGDTLLVGIGARTDLPGGSAGQLWSSLREVLGTLPGRTLVLPSHEAEGRLFSTIDIEMCRNPDWRPMTREAFLAAKAEERVRADGDVRRRLEYNMSLSPVETAESRFGSFQPSSGDAIAGRRVASINVEKFAQKVKERAEGTCFLDVREPEEFLNGHMPGSRNIPLSELGLHLDELSAFRRIYVSCQAGRRSLVAVKTLDYVGLPDVVNVSGGFRAWENAGFSVEK